MAEIKKLGRYELRRVLGKGAMGVVYEGFDPALDRPVAVKTILKSVVIDEETAVAFSARFEREAKAAARLSHPHIVHVYDFGEQDDIAYLVMEFIEGRELRACFEARERFEAADTVRIMSELLDALDFAHEAGVVHRDVKPANIMLDAQRRVKLADFGVARLQDGTDRSKGGTLVGTPAFMSPEQISGGRIDRRSDVFSAGIVLYQLLTGEEPFKGEGAWTVAKHIMQDEPPRPSTIATRVPPAFDQVINQALAKKPDQRYASAKEFAAALQAALAGDKPTGVQRGSDAEIEFWRSIQNSADRAEFEVYLKEFPQGVYADLARLKISRLAHPGTGGPVPPALPGLPSQAPESAEITLLAKKTAELEGTLARRAAEQREHEAELNAEREAEARARAEADQRFEAEERAHAVAEERARLEAIETAKREAQAELARREAEYRRRETEALAEAEAAAKARRAAEARARKDAEARDKAEAEERGRREAEMRADAEMRKKTEAEETARRQAGIQRREAELKKLAAQVSQTKTPVLQLAVAFAVIVAGAIGAWYWTASSDHARVAALTAALEAATKATQDLDLARQRQEELRKRVELAHLAEDEARAKGDQTKLKELQEQTRKAEAEAQKQAELVKQRESEAKKADDAAKVTDAKKQTETARAADKAAQEKAAAEKLAEEKAAAEKLAAEKIAAEKAAAAKATPQKPAATKPPAVAARLPGVGDRWVYEARNLKRSDLNFEMVVEIQAASSSSVREIITETGGAAIEATHRPGAYAIRGSVPGSAMFSPYFLAFQDLHEGQAWPTIDYDHRGLGTCVTDHSLSCVFGARVVGREKVTVKAGTFEAWKIVMEGRFRNKGGYFSAYEVTYWFAERPKRYVKSELRWKVATGLTEEMDVELVSYATAAAQASAPRLAAVGLPGVGDRWVYEARDANYPDKKYQAVVEVVSASSSAIRETFRSPSGTLDLTHQAGAVMIGVAPGIASFMPYLRAFQDVRDGERWLDIEFKSLWDCSTANLYCKASARVAGKERVSVRGGTYDTWKVVVEFSLRTERSGGSGEFIYWYAEEAKRFVKYQSRVNIAGSTQHVQVWLQPNMDMELVSYTPAGSK